MPAWLIPLLKSVLPHVGTIVSAAAPVFTRKSADAAAANANVNANVSQPELLQQQITELQAAVSGNDVHIKELAIQIQNTVEALEAGASLAETRHQRIVVLCVLAIILSAIAFGSVMYKFIAR